MQKITITFTADYKYDLGMFEFTGIKNASATTFNRLKLDVTWICEEIVTDYTSLFDYEEMKSWSVKMTKVSDSNKV